MFAERRAAEYSRRSTDRLFSAAADPHYAQPLSPRGCNDRNHRPYSSQSFLGRRSTTAGDDDVFGGSSNVQRRDREQQQQESAQQVFLSNCFFVCLINLQIMIEMDNGPETVFNSEIKIEKY